MGNQLSADGIRVWLGVKAKNFANNYQDFSKKIRLEFMPKTGTDILPLGLFYYFPIVFPESHSAQLPDEIALVIYPSDAHYREIKSTETGARYAKLHTDVFYLDKNDPFASSSKNPIDWNNLFTENTPYTLTYKLTNKDNISATFFVTEIAQNQFDQLTVWINNYQPQLQADSNIIFSIITIKNNFLFYWEGTKNNTIEPKAITELQQLLNATAPHKLNKTYQSTPVYITEKGITSCEIGEDILYDFKLLPAHSATKNITLYGYNGAPLRAPESTIESLWAALGCGAQGLYLDIFMTDDLKILCIPPTVFSAEVDKTTKKLQYIDAGKSLPINNDYPWAEKVNNATLAPRAKISYSLLHEVFRQLGSRTYFLLNIPHNQDVPRINMHSLKELCLAFGILNNTKLVVSEKIYDNYVGLFHSDNMMVWIDHKTLAQNNIPAYKNIAIAIEKREDLEQLINSRILENFAGTLALVELNRVANATALLQLINTTAAITYVSQDVLTQGEQLLNKGLHTADSFAGTKINSKLWSAGYSHINTETQISINDEFIIDIKQGTTYSGAGAVTRIPIAGDFDAQVEFSVSNPALATTFEMAAIAIDPGNIAMDNSKLNGKTVNLTFDVHGAPPYASAERDENEGFRCGWNNAYNLTKFGDDQFTAASAWDASSANMYNKYGRDVGDASFGSCMTGKLRLIRSGQIFTTLYWDEKAQYWICSGTALVSSMPNDAFIRIAAKHWGKKNNPYPANRVSFKNFILFKR